MWVALAGGNWNNGSNAGLFHWDVNNDASNANLSCGSRALRLKYKKSLMHFVFLTAWSKMRRRLWHGLVGSISKNREGKRRQETIAEQWLNNG